MAIVIEQRVQLDRPFGAPEFRPRKDAQAQIDHTGVKGVELVAEAKAMLRHLIQALLIELDEQRLVDAIRAAFIGVGERTAPDLGGPNGVVERNLRLVSSAKTRSRRLVCRLSCA